MTLTAPGCPGGAVAARRGRREGEGGARRDRREGRRRVGTGVGQGSDVRRGEAAAGTVVIIGDTRSFRRQPEGRK